VTLHIVLSLVVGLVGLSCGIHDKYITVPTYEG
jgi:hypothetical protein